MVGRSGYLARGMPRNAFRPSLVFLALVGVCVGGAVMLWTGVGITTVNVFLFVIAGWLVSLSLHEYAHALLGYRAGDHSVVSKGYLTLNPLKYTHPILSIVLPVLIVFLGGIGLPGGAVWIDRHAVRTRLEDSLISAAGPAVNVAFTIVLALPFMFGLHLSGGEPEFWAALAFLGFLQLTASVLNLLPIPGLDGGNLLRPWLPPTWVRLFDVVAPFGLLLLFVALFEPRVNVIFFSGVYTLTDLAGIPVWLVQEGRALLQFWR